MRAGSSRGIGRKSINGFVIASGSTPVVEIDTEATAAYVRFSRGKVAKTQPFGSRDSMVMVDFDARGRVLGIEIVGTQEFSIGKLLENAPVRLSKSTMNRARYVTADLVPA